MKKNQLYILLISISVIAIAAILYSYNRKASENANKIYTLLPRKGVSKSDKEWEKVRNQSNVLLDALKQEPTDIKANLALAALFIQEARASGNHMYYDAAALKHINRVLAGDTSNFNALVFKSLIYLSQHHFAEGLQTAKKAQKINPYNAYVYGLMVDANVEMGNYDSAVANADKMVSVRPDLTSYSRISYVREILGDYPGAVEAMRMAVTAGGPGDENGGRHGGAGGAGTNKLPQGSWGGADRGNPVRRAGSANRSASCGASARGGSTRTSCGATSTDSSSPSA